MTWSFFRDKDQSSQPKPRLARRNRGTRVVGRRRPLFEELEQRHLLAVLTVNTDTDVVASDNVLTLREALNVVNAGNTVGLSAAELAQIDLTNPLGTSDVVQFDATFFATPRTLTFAAAAGDLDIESAVSVNGPGVANLEIIDNAGTPSRLFNITNTTGDVTIKGLELTGGNAGALNGGGAIFSEAFGLLTVSDSLITGNTAQFAGAIYASGDLTVTGTTIGGAAALANTATGGGGGAIFTYGNVVVKNSTVTGNSTAAGFDGGGFLVYGNVSLENSTVSGNKALGAAGDGGGIYAETVSLVNSTVSGNEAGRHGGGIYSGANAGPGTVTLLNSTVSGNLAGADGGGIYATGIVTLEKSTVGGIAASASNKASSDGGGIFGLKDVILVNSTVSGNEATGNNGGGIYAFVLGSTVTLRNSTVSSNKAASYGGGIYAQSVVVQNSTIASNIANSDNGAVGTGGGVFANTRFQMTNSIVVGNTTGAANGFPDLNIPAGNSTVRASLIGDNTGLPAEAQFNVSGPNAKNPTGNFIGTPAGVNAIPVTAPAGSKSAFGSGAGAGTLADNLGPTPTIALSNADSIAIDTGRNNLVVGAPLGDQRGAPPFVRIFGGTVDMGAFEFQTVAANIPPVLATAIPDQTALVDSPFVFTFAANAFTDADGDTLTYTATLSPAGALPAWLTFTQGTAGRTFVGVPTAADVGTITIRVTASDGKGGFATDDFTLTVVASELPFNENFEGAVPPGQIAPNPRIQEKSPGFNTGNTGPINGTQSLIATRPNPGARPVATVDFAAPITNTAVTSVSVNVNLSPSNGDALWSNAIIIFDYVSPTNYKYAGLFQVLDKLIIGQVKNGAVQRLKLANFPATANTTYPLTLTINRTTNAVTLNSGATSVSHTFSSPLGSGAYGLGTINANAKFDNLTLLG